MAVSYSPMGVAASSRRQRRSVSTLVAALCVVLFCLVSVGSLCFDTPTSANPVKKQKIKVVLKMDVQGLGKAGDTVKVKRGYMRNRLLPKGQATRCGKDVTQKLLEAKKRVEQKKASETEEALDKKVSIESLRKLVFPKQVRGGAGDDSKKIYGSLTAAQVAEEIIKKTGIPVRLTSIQIPKIVELGTFAVTIDLGENVYAYLDVEVVSSADGGKEEKQ